MKIWVLFKPQTLLVEDGLNFGSIKGADWISSNYSFIQYCDSNIGLFSIAPPL